MNAYTEIKMKIATGQRKFGIHTIERLLAQMDALREKNAQIRQQAGDARQKLRSAQINWQEDCYFECDDMLTGIVEGV